MFALPRFEELLEHVASIGYYVDSKFRHQGIGSMLMEELINQSKIKELQVLTAEVADDNIYSQKLLKKFKFQEFGILKNGMMKKDGKLIDLIYFSKEI